MAEVPIDRDWAWVIVCGAFINTFFTVGGFKTVGIIFVHVLERFQASQGLTAWMIGLLSFGLSIYSPVATALALRFSYRVSIILGGIAMSLGFFLTAFATDINYVICVLGILGGVGNGFLYTPSMILVGQYFHRQRSLAMGIAAAGGSFGQLVIPFLIRYLLDNYSFQGCMLIYSAIVLHTVLAGFLMRPQSFYRQDKPKPEVSVKVEEVENAMEEPVVPVTPSNSLNSLVFRSQIQDSLTSTPMTNLDDNPKLKELAQIDDSSLLAPEPTMENVRLSAHYSSTGSLCIVPQDKNEWDRIVPQKTEGKKSDKREQNTCIKAFQSLFNRQVFKMKAFWIYFVATILGNAGYIDQIIFIPPYGKEIGITSATRALILAVSGIADLVGRVSGGFLNNLKVLKTGYFVSVCLMTAVIIVGVCLFYPCFVSLMAHGVALGALGGMYIALFPVALVEVVGLEKFPSAFAFTMFGVGFANLPLPTVFGRLSDWTGSYFISFSLLNGMVLMSAVLFMVVPLVQNFDRGLQEKPTSQKPPSEKVAESEKDAKV